MPSAQNAQPGRAIKQREEVLYLVIDQPKGGGGTVGEVLRAAVHHDGLRVGEGFISIPLSLGEGQAVNAGSSERVLSFFPSCGRGGPWRSVALLMGSKWIRAADRAAKAKKKLAKIDARLQRKARQRAERRLRGGASATVHLTPEQTPRA